MYVHVYPSGLSLRFEASIANEDSSVTSHKNLLSGTFSFPHWSPVTSSELSHSRCYGLIMALNDISVLNQKSHTRDPNKMRGSKEFLFILFLPANFMSSFHKYHVGNFDTWLSLEERNLKLFIWVSTSQSVPREMQN